MLTPSETTDLLGALYETLRQVISLAMIGQTDPQSLLQLAADLKAAIAAGGIWVLAAYFFVYTLITALCLPGGSILMLAGGASMGFMECLLLSNAACTLGAWFTFLAARVGLRNNKPEARWLQTIERRLADHTLAFLVSIRLAPVIPFAVFNVLAGLSDLRSWRFVWTSFVGMLPGTWLYVNAGAQLGHVASLDELLGWDVMASVAALAIVPWIANGLHKRWTKLQGA